MYNKPVSKQSPGRRAHRYYWYPQPPRADAFNGPSA